MIENEMGKLNSILACDAKEKKDCTTVHYVQCLINSTSPFKHKRILKVHLLVEGENSV